LFHFARRSLLLPITWVCTWRNVWVEIRHLSLKAIIDTFQIPFLFSHQCFLCIWYVSSWKFTKLQFFLRLLILGFISRQESKGKLLFHLCSTSYLSSTKLYSSSPPSVFVLNRVFLEVESSTVLNNFDFNEKRAFLLCLWKYCFSRRSLAFNVFVKILVPSLPSYCRRAWGFTKILTPLSHFDGCPFSSASAIGTDSNPPSACLVGGLPKSSSSSLLRW